MLFSSLDPTGERIVAEFEVENPPVARVVFMEMKGNASFSLLSYLGALGHGSKGGYSASSSMNKLFVIPDDLWVLGKRDSSILELGEGLSSEIMTCRVAA